MISTATAVGLFLLARNLGHEWAAHTSQRRIEEVGWETAALEASASMEAEPKLGPAGLHPATDHITGSGRLSWHAQGGAQGGLLLRVNRPGEGLRGSTRVVLRCVGTCVAGWALHDVEVEWPQCHLRHVQALASAILGGSSPGEVEMILDELGREMPPEDETTFAAFAAKVNADAEAEAAAFAAKVNAAAEAKAAAYAAVAE